MVRRPTERTPEPETDEPDTAEPTIEPEPEPVAAKPPVYLPIHIG
ncbi:hypothetical protein ACFWPK_04385 [Nocardia sp. NPDC058519]